MFKYIFCDDDQTYVGELAGEVTTDADGNFSYELDTAYLAEGEYYVLASYTYLETPAVRVYADGSIRKTVEEPLESCLRCNSRREPRW